MAAAEIDVPPFGSESIKVFCTLVALKHAFELLVSVFDYISVHKVRVGPYVDLFFIFFIFADV